MYELSGALGEFTVRQLFTLLINRRDTLKTLLYEHTFINCRFIRHFIRFI